MPKFSKQSKGKLKTCHPNIQKVMNQVIKFYDITVIYGYRSSEEQLKLYEKGREYVYIEGVSGQWETIDENKIVTNCNGRDKKSFHNYDPSLAIDIAPYPIDWKNEKRFYYMAGIVMYRAQLSGIALKWGGDFKSLKDLGHFEINI